MVSPEKENDFLLKKSNVQHAYKDCQLFCAHHVLVYSETDSDSVCPFFFAARILHLQRLNMLNEATRLGSVLNTCTQQGSTTSPGRSKVTAKV